MEMVYVPAHLLTNERFLSCTSGRRILKPIHRVIGFWINLPVGAVTAGFLLFTHIPNQEKKKSTGQTRWTIKSVMHEFDLIGFTLFAPASIMLLIALEWGGTEYAWNSSTIIGLLCGSVATFCVFVFWERHQSDEAMIPIGMMSQRVIYSSCLSAGLQGASLLVLSYYLPLWFQIIKHDSPTTSAVDTLPIFLCQIVAAIVSSMLGKWRISLLSFLPMLGSTKSFPLQGRSNCELSSTGRDPYSICYIRQRPLRRRNRIHEHIHPLDQDGTMGRIPNPHGHWEGPFDTTGEIATTSLSLLLFRFLYPRH